MSDIPDSYEDLEEIIKNRKKKRRSSLVKTLLITVISIIALFVIWLLYPVSAPEYAMRDLLPEQTAVSAELHHPRDLLQHLQKTDYLRHTAELPIWSSFQREYAVEFRDKVLQNDIEEFIQELTETADNLIGIRNILAAAGGISYPRQDRTPVYSAIVWLDNIGVLSTRLSTFFKPPKTYKGMKYYRLKINSHEVLYIALTPSLPRAVLFSTDLESIGNFRIDNNHSRKTKLTKHATAIEVSVSLRNIPQNNLLHNDQTLAGDLDIIWTPEEITASCSLLLPDFPIIPSNGTTLPKSIQVSNSAPSLTLNIQLPPQATAGLYPAIIQELSRNRDTLSRLIAKNINPALFAHLKNRLALLLTEPEKPDTLIFPYAHLYLETNKASNTKPALEKTLNSILSSCATSNDLSIRLLSSQIKLSSEADSSILYIPFIPEISATFNRIATTNYLELKLKSTPPYAPALTNQSTRVLTTNWSYSHKIAESIAYSIPDGLKNTPILYISRRHTILLNDIINFLSSTNFFSLSIDANYDNKSNTLFRFNAQLQPRQE